MISKLHHKPLPTFEQWLQNSKGDGFEGSDVRLSDDLGLKGWYSNTYGIESVKKNPSLNAEDTISIPMGDYTIGDQDYDYILLIPSDKSDLDRYLVKRYDFEEVKHRIKG